MSLTDDAEPTGVRREQIANWPSNWAKIMDLHQVDPLGSSVNLDPL